MTRSNRLVAVTERRMRMYQDRAEAVDAGAFFVGKRSSPEVVLERAESFMKFWAIYIREMEGRDG